MKSPYTLILLITMMAMLSSCAVLKKTKNLMRARTDSVSINRVEMRGHSRLDSVIISLKKDSLNKLLNHSYERETRVEEYLIPDFNYDTVSGITATRNIIYNRPFRVTIIKEKGDSSLFESRVNLAKQEQTVKKADEKLTTVDNVTHLNKKEAIKDKQVERKGLNLVFTIALVIGSILTLLFLFLKARKRIFKL